MGSFANTLFQLMLGWMQGIVSSVWSAFTSENGGSFFTWLGNHWIPIVLVLCAAGLIADLTVYLVRWKPYRVWRSFFHRGKETDGKTAPEGQPARKGREPVRRNPDGTASRVIRGVLPERHADVRPEGVHTGHVSPHPAQSDLSSSDSESLNPAWHHAGLNTEAHPESLRPVQDPVKRKPDFSRRQQEEPVTGIPTDKKTVPVTVTPAGYRVPADSPHRRPPAVPAAEEENEKEDFSTGKEMERSQQAIYRRRRRIHVSDLFSDPEEDLRTIDAPQQVIDSQKAYHAPVYPRGWKKSGDERE